MRASWDTVQEGRSASAGLSMGSGLAERSIRAHNLLEYMDR